jgi:FkbM family methyltransferase
MIRLTPSYKTTRIIRKAIPWLATYIATLGGKRRSWDRYWDIFTSSIYKSFLSRLKVMVSLPDGCHALIRPFSLDDAIIPEIFEHKSYELYGGPKPGDVVVDAGAHVGFFTIRTSKLVGSDGLVIAVEPHPENYEMLLQNIRINSLNNVIPIKAALGNREGFAELSIDRKWTSGHSIAFRKGANSVRVPLMTLDSLVKKLGLARVDFIKIDVEGAEYMLLEGARRVLKTNNLRLAIEAGDCIDIRKKCLEFLKEMGYKVIERGVYVYAWR